MLLPLLLALLGPAARPAAQAREPLPGDPFERLTPRQREVLQLVAEGNTTKAIAQRLGISVKTVETYRAQLMETLDIHEIAGLTRYAIRRGIVCPHA